MELFGFDYDKYATYLNLNVKTFENDGNLFGALSRRIAPKINLCASENLLKLSVPPLEITESILLNHNSINNNKTKEVKNRLNDYQSNFPGPLNDNIECISNNKKVHIPYKLNKRKFFSECSKDELQLILQTKNLKNNVDGVYSIRDGPDFIKDSFNALFGYSSNTYNCSNSNLPELQKSICQFYLEIKIIYLLIVYIEKLTNYYFYLNTRDTRRTSYDCYAEISSATHTILHLYHISMSSLIVAINYYKIYELNSILSWTSSLRQYIILVFQIIASDDIKSVLFQYLTNKTVSKYISFQDAMIPILETSFSIDKISNNHNYM